MHTGRPNRRRPHRTRLGGRWTMSIEACGVTKTFGRFTALRNVSLKVETGELVALLGPSGSGKTTLLRVIAGLETLDAGSIWFHGEDATNRRVQDRGVGFVFQHYALFRHMTVFENVAFGLRVLPRKVRPSRAEINSRVRQLLDLVQLEWLADRRPGQLSGGQRQRTALARALAVGPKVLLLDEPFGALDARVRQELRRWLRRLHDEIRITGVIVTHDQEEALELADRVVVMNDGQIQQIGTPREVFHQPANEFVMNFLGNVNVFHGRLEDGKAIFGPVEMAYTNALARSSGARVFVRPHELNISAQPENGNCLRAKIRYLNAAGPRVKVEMESESGETIYAELSQEKYQELEVGAGSLVYVVPQRITVFPDDYAI
jgi:sulfate/thiosulfate transport system ATP-binding protein